MYRKTMRSNLDHKTASRLLLYSSVIKVMISGNCLPKVFRIFAFCSAAIFWYFSFTFWLVLGSSPFFLKVFVILFSLSLFEASL